MLLPLPFSRSLGPLPRVVRLRWRDAVEALGLGRVGATRCANCRAETGQGEILPRMRVAVAVEAQVLQDRVPMREPMCPNLCPSYPAVKVCPMSPGPIIPA